VDRLPVTELAENEEARDDEERHRDEPGDDELRDGSGDRWSAVDGKLGRTADTVAARRVDSD
jgi:hypothetical protein